MAWFGLVFVYNAKRNWIQINCCHMDFDERESSHFKQLWTTKISQNRLIEIDSYDEIKVIWKPLFYICIQLFDESWSTSTCLTIIQFSTYNFIHNQSYNQREHEEGTSCQIISGTAFTSVHNALKTTMQWKHMKIMPRPAPNVAHKISHFST